MSERTDDRGPAGHASAPQTGGTRPEPHPGWSGHSQEAYTQADSGGWGGPGRSGYATGPVPRLRGGSGRRPDDGSEADGDRAAAEPLTRGDSVEPGGQGEHRGHDVALHESPVSATPSERHAAAAADRRDDKAAERPAAGGHADWYEGGPGLRRRGFRTRLTETLAPRAFWLVVVWLVVDYMRSIYDYSLVAAHGGAADGAGMFVLVVAGLFKVVALAAIARLVAELCQNVAALARTTDERRDR